MTTFIGDYPCKLDAKGRFALPSALLKQFGEAEEYRFVIKKDIFEDCLVMYPIQEWERQVALLREKLNPYNREHNKFMRGFFRGTAEIVLDKSNRILLPKRLTEPVSIDKDILLAGQDNKIEIWDKNLYESLDDEQGDFAELAEKILGDNTPPDIT